MKTQHQKKSFYLSVFLIFGSFLFSMMFLQPASAETAAGLTTLQMRASYVEGRRAIKRAATKTNYPKNVCSSSSSASGLLIKAEASNHIQSADARTTGYTLICGKRCVSFPARVFYCDGTQAASLGYYGVWSKSHGGNGKARAYGAAGGAPQHYVSKIRTVARRKNCGRTLFLQVSSQRKNQRAPACLSWDSNSSRVGSPW